jgi:hypothetical protein
MSRQSQQSSRWMSAGRCKQATIMSCLSHRRIFSSVGSVILPILCAVLLGFDVPSEAGTKPFSYQASGTVEPTLFTFPDGYPTSSVTFNGMSTLGPITVNIWVTAGGGQTVFPVCTPPSGVPGAGEEFKFNDHLDIIRFHATGDILIQNLISGTICLDASSGFVPPFAFKGMLTVNNVGGTGKFAGASGTATENFVGEYVSCGNDGCVGYAEQDETGTVTTP